MHLTPQLQHANVDTKVCNLDTNFASGEVVGFLSVGGDLKQEKGNQHFLHMPGNIRGLVDYSSNSSHHAWEDMWTQALGWHQLPFKETKSPVRRPSLLSTVPQLRESGSRTL